MTRVEVAASTLDPEKVERSLSTENDRVLSMIGRNLPDEHKQSALAVHEAEQVVAVHMAAEKPDWVTSNGPDRSWPGRVARTAPRDLHAARDTLTAG